MKKSLEQLQVSELNKKVKKAQKDLLAQQKALEEDEYIRECHKAEQKLKTEMDKAYNKYSIPRTTIMDGIIARFMYEQMRGGNNSITVDQTVEYLIQNEPLLKEYKNRLEWNNQLKDILNE